MTGAEVERLHEDRAMSPHDKLVEELARAMIHARARRLKARFGSRPLADPEIMSIPEADIDNARACLSALSKSETAREMVAEAIYGHPAISHPLQRDWSAARDDTQQFFRENAQAALRALASNPR